MSRIETSATPSPHVPVSDRNISTEEDLPGLAANLLESSLADQRYCLRNDFTFRSAVFLETYVEKLDYWRYENATAAAYLAETVVCELIPTIADTRNRRTALCCRGMGVFASAKRLTGDYVCAAQVLLAAIALARRHDLSSETASLLRRASYVLSLSKQYERSLAINEKAIPIYALNGDDMEVARCMVDRALFLQRLEDPKKAEQAYMRGIASLQREGGCRRCLASCYCNMAHMQAERGQIDAAEKSLLLLSNIKDISTLPSKTVSEAKIAYARRDLAKAELFLRESFRMYEERGDISVVAVGADLLQLQSERGRLEDARKLARWLRFMAENAPNAEVASEWLRDTLKAVRRCRVPSEDSGRVMTLPSVRNRLYECRHP